MMTTEDLARALERWAACDLNDGDVWNTDLHSEQLADSLADAAARGGSNA